MIIDQVDQGAPYVWIIVKDVTSHKDSGSININITLENPYNFVVAKP